MDYGKNGIRNRHPARRLTVLNRARLQCGGMVCRMRWGLFPGLLVGMMMAGVPLSVEAQSLNLLGSSSDFLTQSIIRSVRTIIRPKLRIVHGRIGPVAELRLNHDQDLLLALLGDGNARLWDLKGGGNSISISERV